MYEIPTGEEKEIFMQGWIPLERLWEEFSEVVSKFITHIQKPSCLALVISHNSKELIIYAKYSFTI